MRELELDDQLSCPVLLVQIYNHHCGRLFIQLFDSVSKMFDLTADQSVGRSIRAKLRK